MAYVRRNFTQAAFLKAYEVIGTVKGAAVAAKVDRQEHYKWLRGDEAYAAKFAAMRQTVGHIFEEEARRRAMEGVERLKFHEGKAIIDPRTGTPYIEREYSDRLLETLLRCNLPDVYSERQKLEHTGEVALKVIERQAKPPEKLA